MKDLLTGEDFEPKRSNQKFACRENRVKYHNLKAGTERHATAKLDRPLKINKRILDELLSDRTEATLSQDYLLGKGFDFHVSNRIQTYQGQNHFCVYQYIIINDNDKKTTKIVKDAGY